MFVYKHKNKLLIILKPNNNFFGDTFGVQLSIKIYFLVYFVFNLY